MIPTKSTSYATREEWLKAAVELLKPTFKRAGLDIPVCQVSTGWPSRGATSKKARCIGECWDATTAEDKRPHVFISPVLDNKRSDQGVLPTLLHELIHAAVGCSCGHRGAFKKSATKLGLIGKMKSTTAGPELMVELNAIAEKLGLYPHGPLHNVERRRTKRDECRMIKCICDECGYVVRTTKKWLTEKGAPICPCNRKNMSFELPETDDENNDE